MSWWQPNTATSGNKKNDDASRLGEIPGGWRFAAKMAADEERKGRHGWLQAETQRAAKLGCGLKRK